MMTNPTHRGWMLLTLAALAAGAGLQWTSAAPVSGIFCLAAIWVSFVAASRRAIRSVAIIGSLLLLAGCVASIVRGNSPPAAHVVSLFAIGGAAMLAQRVLELVNERAEVALKTEESVSVYSHQQQEDARKRRAMANVLQDLEEERTALKQEIEARRKVQELLEASEQRFFGIIELAPTAMVMIDDHGFIVYVNAETESLFGYQRTELLHEPIEILVPERYRMSHPALRDRFLRNPAAHRMGGGRDLFGRRKDGTEVPIEIALNPIRTDEGLFVLSAIMDITERKQAEEEIHRINAELRRKNDEIQQFVYTVSHDLKSPLVTCKGFVGMMKEDAEEQRWDEMLDSAGRVERATERMGELIDDLLELSRIGVIRNDPVAIDVGAVAGDLVESLSERIKHVGARVEIQPNLPTVVADPVRFREVLENLLSNAIKYGARGKDPRIKIGGHPTSVGVRYHVKDNGPGIAKEFHQKIFGLFHRLENGGDGTGVGLAAVARIMERHGGRVGVDSEAGNGAKFWVEFPMEDPENAASKPKAIAKGAMTLAENQCNV